MPQAVSVAPNVDSYDELRYSCTADDTYPKLSQRFYQNEKYARALQLFNSNHPRATDAVRQNPPALANQPIYVPPLRILEKYYSSAITDYKPLPAIAPPPLTPAASAPAPAPVTPASYAAPATSATTTTPATTPSASPAPAPAPTTAAAPTTTAPAASPAPTSTTPAAPAASPAPTSTTPAAPAASPAAAPAPTASPASGAAAAAPEKRYRVDGNGEMVRDIAAKTLGNRDRSTDINLLNQNRINPEYPIPAGTVLRLPGDARVAAQGSPPGNTQ
jgi:hypothetical protein